MAALQVGNGFAHIKSAAANPERNMERLLKNLRFNESNNGISGIATNNFCSLI